MIAKAAISDADDIYALLAPQVAREVILPRSIDEIYEFIRSFIVYRDGARGPLRGVSALHIYGPTLGEVRSLVVDPSLQGTGVGKQLVEHCLYEAALLGLQRVFVLTYETEFFRKLGFVETDKSIFPEKVFTDCARCPKVDACDERAMIFTLG